MTQNKKNKINKQKQQQFKEKTTMATKNADFIFFGIPVSQYLFFNWFFWCVFFYFLNVKTLRLMVVLPIQLCL